MKKSLKTLQIADAYQLIDKADYKGLSNEDKIALWKTSRALKPVATQFLSDKEDAIKSFVTPEFTEAFKQVLICGEKKKLGEDLPISLDEYRKYCKDVQEANALMESAIGEFADKEVEIEFKPLSEIALGVLITSNNWAFSQTECLEWMLEEN